MPPGAVLFLCAIVVAVLIRLERTHNPSASGALWIPTCWMLIAGSRAVGRWLGGAQDTSAIDGSLADRLVLTTLLFLALAVILARPKIAWSRILKDNVWVIALFLYMGLSIFWAEYPYVSLKRWTKSAGAVVMALMIMSEARPLEALGSVLRRCAYILIPVSLVLIKYFPQFGRVYGRWDGLEMWTGVTTHKNSLGQLCAVSVFFLIWSLLRKSESQNPVRSRIHIFADIFVLGLGLFLLIGPGGTYSATSVLISVVGVATMLLLKSWKGLARLIAQNMRVTVVTLALMYLLLADAMMSTVTSILGRAEDLTGRATGIWPVVLAAAARHPFLGAGYGGVWGLGGEVSSIAGVEQAHNGYLDVYLELGFVGVVLLVGFFLNFSSQIRKQFNNDVSWGVFGVCFVLMTLLYNLSETAFFDVYLGAAMVLVPVALSARLGDASEQASKTRPVPTRIVSRPVGRGRAYRGPVRLSKITSYSKTKPPNR